MLAYDSSEDRNEGKSEEGSINVGDKVRLGVRVVREYVLRAQVSESFPPLWVSHDLRWQGNSK